MRAWVDRTIFTAIGAYVVARLMTLAAIVVASQLHRGDLDNLLGKSDGVWYLGIAQHGYRPMSSLAFFPLYPLLIRLFSLPDLSYLGAALRRHGNRGRRRGRTHRRVGTADRR